MKITNHHNLPPGFVNVVERGQHPPKIDRFSVTDLIGPPLIRTLRMEKWDELETDVSDYLWMLLGIGVDDLISSSTDKDSIRQHKMVHRINDYDVVGKIDVINDDVLADYKCTSVASSFYPIKDEYIAQLNTYCWMLTQERKESKDTIPIRYLRLYNIYRDWRVRDAQTQENYPKIPFETIDVPKWTEEQQQNYILSRLDDHNNNPHRMCTSEECWASETTYAVKTKGKKRAERVKGLTSKEHAENWMNKTGRGDYVEVRPGEKRRCSHYCPVRSVCPYAKG